jgi:hypothetical protein
MSYSIGEIAYYLCSSSCICTILRFAMAYLATALASEYRKISRLALPSQVSISRIYGISQISDASFALILEGLDEPNENEK